jgi:hypothetical protein
LIKEKEKPFLGAAEYTFKQRRKGTASFFLEEASLPLPTHHNPLFLSFYEKGSSYKKGSDHSLALHPPQIHVSQPAS